MRRHYQYPLLYILLFSSLLSNDLFAQGFGDYTWYFGNSTLGIRFNKGDKSATAVSNASPLGTGGGAVAADPVTGTILFYTDGVNVYDVTNAQMPNGSGLNANTAGNQPVVVGAIPGQTDQYYIFTNTANNTTGGIISITTVDMTLPGNGTAPTPPLGDVVNPKNIVIPGLANRSEAMILIPHTNGTDYWLVTQENGTSNYSVTLIDDTGTFPTTTYSGAGFSMTAANFAYNEASGNLAVSPQNANVDIHLFTFNNDNGQLAPNPTVPTIPNTATTTATDQAIYDVEWSPSGQYLYISIAGDGAVQAEVLQFDLLSPTTSLASVLPQPNSIYASYGLQIGPDSTIYHLYQETAGGPYLLGGITDADTVASQVTYTEEIFPGDFGGTQFPSFQPYLNQDITISFTSDGTCSGVPTSFFPEVSPGADSLVWDFGDGFGSSDWAPIHAYENGGTYPVTVTAYLNGQTQMATVPVNITQFDTQITLVQDTTACSCELPFPKNPDDPCTPFFSVTAEVQGTYTSAVWSDFNRTNGLTLSPDSAGYYYLVVTDANTGCAAYAGVNIREYDVQDQRANIWYFGQNAGIDFNPLPDDPAVTIDGPVNSPEGVAVISDRNGQVVFSTDGINVYNKNDILVPTPPDGIGGSSESTQSAIIIPVPGDETLFYIFTTKDVYGDGTYEVRYSLYDLKLNNGDGGLVEYNVLLFEPSTERLTGSGNWLIAHEFGNNSFRAYEVTSNGISAPVISSAGSDHSFAEAQNAQGYMKLGPGNKLAVALSTPGVSNVVEIFDFNDSTGVVNNFRAADLTSSTGQVYGVEFSPAGNKLYATLKDGTSNSSIYEFAFDSLGNVYKKQPPPATPQSGELGALQIGPDGQIYVAVNGETFIYSFGPLEDTTMTTPLNLQQVDLVGGTGSTLGLPNFIQNISTPVQGPTISVAGNCLGSPTNFTATGRDPNIETYSWNFGDGEGTDFLTTSDTTHQYAAAGTYPVSVTLRNRCDIDTVLYMTVVITAPPDDPTFIKQGDFPNLCTGSLTLEATPDTNPDLSFIWSTGETTREIVVNQRGNYSVSIVDNFGCSSNGTITIADQRPMVELGPDLTICQNTPIFPLDAQNPGTTYQWEINGVNSGTSQTQSVDTSVPGMFEYKVQVTDPITSCTVRDSLTYTFNQSPVFTAVPNAPSACLTPDGSIDITITDPATSLFTYSVTGPSPGSSAIDQPIGPYNVGSLGAGTYGVTVSDQISGCFSITTASINDDAFTVAGMQNATCDPIGIDVTAISTVTTNPIAGPLTYRVINSATGVVVEQPMTSIPSGTFSTDPAGLPSNNQNYIVEVTSSGCVTSSNAIPVNQSPRPVVSLSSQNCTNPITVAVSGGTGWTWSGPNITSANNLASITATPPQGPQIYSVTVTDGGGLCPLDTAITVQVDNMITPIIAQGDPCSDQVTVTASPNGPYIYQWYNSVGLDNSLGGNPILLNSNYNGDRIYVEVYNPVSGCRPRSNDLDITVIGSLDLTLTTTPACEGEQFTISGSTNQAVGNYEWSYEGSVINGQTLSTLVDTRAGEYLASVSVASCTAKDSIQILLAPITPGSLVSRAIICNDPANTDPNTSEVVLDPGAGFNGYTWFRNGQALGVTDPTYTATEDGTYSVELLNSFGCQSTDQTVVEIDCIPKITGPNAFRPDGLNSNFFLYTFFIDDAPFEVFIYSRWGELVYQSVQRQFEWNGGYNNNASKPLPPGTYSYLVRYKSSYRPEDGIREKRGGVVLLR